MENSCALLQMECVHGIYSAANMSEEQLCRASRESSEADVTS